MQFSKELLFREEGKWLRTLKEGPGTEKGFRESRHQQLTSLPLMCSSSGAQLLTASISQRRVCLLAVCYWHQSCWQCVSYATGIWVDVLHKALHLGFLRSRTSREALSKGRELNKTITYSVYVRTEVQQVSLRISQRNKIPVFKTNKAPFLIHTQALLFSSQL